MKKNFITGLALTKKITLIAAVSATLALQSCGEEDGSPRIKDAQEETIYESTKGVITEVEEVEPGEDYKIIDERIIDDKEKSIAIVHTLEGTVDTLSLRKLKDDNSSTYRHSGLRSILYYSLASSYFNRNMNNVTPKQSNYKNASAYNKSTSLKNDLKSSATSRRVSVPGSSSKGYGSGKSFRSFGG
ncbi:hypothetical protein [Winogradskyella endarachnes]|uniref:UPF0323 domain-containing protein n=1 Tax=Winogradskyella endarachnes TaxID=2681965 RepID=A0A6L6U5G5_9FLAO|nr:hypothetical protein [Winogradskyella endarachnes]MUU77400.1 hypothetical protein [Winogradskyella endarachnes]